MTTQTGQTIPLSVGYAAPVQIAVWDQPGGKGNNITGECTIAFQSSDPTIATVINGTSGYWLNALKAGTCSITWTITNPSGSITEVDGITVQVSAPASATIAYGTPVPQTSSN